MDAPEPPKPFAKRLQERLAASRFLTFSVLLHVIIVIAGGSVVVIKRVMDPPDFESSDGLVSPESGAQAPPEQQPDLAQQQFTPQAPQITAPQLQAISTVNIQTPTFQVAAITPQVKAMPTDQISKALQSMPGTKFGASTGMPGTMSGRMGGGGRMGLMSKMGGKQKSEEAVLRGLRWLVKNQNADGSWSGQNRAGMSGLALLCFLGHGELPNSVEFGPTVEKAVNWIMANGEKFEGKLSMAKEFNQPGVYEHGIVTYALGEYYSMTKDERVAELFKKAVDYIIQGQGPDGGWMYSYNKTQSDTSVTGWQIQALKAAHLTGLSIPGIDATMDKAMLNFKRVQGPKGGFGYRTPSDKYSLTGVGVLCTYFWKQTKDKMVREGAEFIIDQTRDKYPIKYKGDSADLYAWYYNTQACLMVGGSVWTTWNRLFQDEICEAQSKDGSWPATAAKGHGPQSDPGRTCAVYRTTLCTLMLEVFYRYSSVHKG